MRIIEIAPLSNGAHRNQSFHSVIEDILEGWAIIPDEMETENFPFGDVEIEEIDGVMTVIKWTPGAMPEPEPINSSVLRENAYNNEAIILWDNNYITVTQASQLWQYYAAEGSLKANILQELIANAKMDIRLKYPD